jgi:outer membrane protein
MYNNDQDAQATFEETAKSELKGISIFRQYLELKTLSKPVTLKRSATMKRFKTFVALVILLGGSARAQEAVSTGPYTLAQCYERALKQSETVAEQMELLVQADESYRQGVGAMLPTISGSYQYQKSEAVGDQPGAPGGIGAQISPTDQRTGKLTLSQPLFRGLRDVATLKQQRKLQDVQRYALRQAQTQLFNDVSQAFYTVLSFERDQENYESQIEANQKRYGEVTRLQRKGNAREADALAIETTIANLESQIENTKGQLKSARQTLAFLTGLDRTMQLTDPDSRPAALAAVESFVSHVDERPDVISARSDVEASRQAVKVQEGAHIPSVDLTGNYYPTRPGLLNDVHWDAGFTVTVPIFSGGVTQSQVRVAQSQERAKGLAYDRSRRQAESDIRSAYDIAEADAAQVVKLERAVAVAKRNYEVELRDYNAGLARNIDVLLASASDLDTKRSLNKMIYTLKTDYAKLQSAAAVWPAQLNK